MGAALQIGRVVDHYHLLEKLGEGGMGVVWLAEDTRLGRKVAIKFLPPEAARDAVRRQRFEQEARAAAAISHPGIATVHELAETEGRTYIVFEYVPGRTLRNHVVRGGLQPEELLDIAGDIADALAAAHTASVVHRDLKPENVMRTPTGTCKVLDFGVARLTATVTPDSATESGSHLTSAGMVVGTVAYMAPEQLGGKEVDFRCDIFSFGTLIYELATGVHPFHGDSSASTIAAIMTGEPPPITQWNRLQPPELERIVRKCLRKRREERYQSTKDLAVDLANLKRDSAERPSSVGAIPAPVHPGDDSLFHKIFASFGATPRGWWELHQLFALFVYAPVALYLALRSSVSISKELNTALASNWHGWQGMMQAIGPESGGPYTFWSNFGLAFFLTLILLLITTVVTRLYLVCLAAFIPERLVAEVRRIQAVLGVVYVLVACQFMFAGFFLLRVNMGELILGTGLAAFGLSTRLAVSYAEPGMVRAAFPQAFAEPKRDRSRTLRIRIAAAQLLYALLLVAPLGLGKLSLDEIMQGISLQPTATQLYLFAYSVVITLGCIALLISAVQMLSEGVPGLRVFRRWFPAYLAIDLVGTGAWVWMGFSGKIPAAIAIGLPVILLALPFAQLRMARQALRESGEVEQEMARSRRDPRFAPIALAQELIVILYAGMLYLAAKAGALQAGPAALAKGEYTTGLAYVLAAPILLAALVSSAALMVRSLQGNTQALRIFLRFFPGYWLLAQAWYVPLIWIAIRTPTILICLVLAPPFGAMPFYQRRLARSLLRESGELKEEQHVAQPSRRATTRTWWGALQVSSVLVVGSALLSMMGAFDVPHWTVIPAALRVPVFFFEVFSGWLNISIRAALGLVALSSPEHLARWVARMRPWIRITGWMIVAGLAVTALAIVSANGTKAAGAGALATVVAASLLIIEPAVEGAAFPST